MKGRAAVGEVGLSSNEFKTAHRLAGDYWLYVVFNCATKPELHTVQDPVRMGWKAVVRVESYHVAPAMIFGSETKDDRKPDAAKGSHMSASDVPETAHRGRICHQEIEAHARREKSRGPDLALHIWWARRPLGACRAALCAALWPDPADPHCDRLFRETAATALCRFAETVRDQARSLLSCAQSIGSNGYPFTQTWDV